MTPVNILASILSGSVAVMELSIVCRSFPPTLKVTILSGVAGTRKFDNVEKTEGTEGSEASEGLEESKKGSSDSILDCGEIMQTFEASFMCMTWG